MKKLLIYYSYTGNTRLVAEMIKKEIDCDIYELNTIEPYPSDYDTLVEEYKDNLHERPEAKLDFVSVDLRNYDEIILGTPVWWYTISPVMRSFLNVFDLSDKKVYAFATNAGWLGKTFEEYKELCPNIISEFSVLFTENKDEHIIKNKDELNEWIEQLKK